MENELAMLDLIVLCAIAWLSNWLLEDSGLYQKIFKPKKISETCIQERKPSYFEFVILMALLYLAFLALPSVIKIIIIASVSGFWIAKRIYKKG